MKIIGILQFYNEKETGFLQQFMKYNLSLFDEVIAYDDGSTDGSSSYCQMFGVKIIRNGLNHFKNEINHKAQLINAADQAQADFIFSIDADEIAVITREKLEAICSEMQNQDLDGYSTNFINLWRSKNFKRVDSLFDDYKPVKLWRHQTGVSPFPNHSVGLHQTLHPSYVKKTVYNSDLIILHTGFSDKKYILEKFVRYRLLGQKGFNLMRFIDERALSVEAVGKKQLPADWPTELAAPTAITVADYFTDIESTRAKILKPKVSIFSLIYKDIEWAKFLYTQILRYTPLEMIEFYFVTNDADGELTSFLIDNQIPFYEYKNNPVQKKGNYINNVYRAYNYGVSKAKGELVLLLNSDMAFTDGWFEALIQNFDDGKVFSSRLVESGKLKSGKHGIEKNFGNSWEDYEEQAFQSYANTIREPSILAGGLYMPLLLKKSDFEQAGGYPEGNITVDCDIFNPRIATTEKNVISGDTAFIKKLKMIGVNHYTNFNSLVYHFQEGEKDSVQSKTGNCPLKKIMICNDHIPGIHGEKVLWGHLLDLPNTIALDYETVGGKTPHAFQERAMKSDLDFCLVFQNATFIERLFPQTYTAMYLQDNLREMRAVSSQQEANIKHADYLVTNSVNTATAYPEYDFEICPIGVDESIFHPRSKTSLREKYGFDDSDRIGIFVGATNQVKGWDEVYETIKERKDITWIVVTKYNTPVQHPRIKHFSNQPQQTVAELLNCSDFFILGSPIETQCLAAIEAALCDIPVVMKPVGLFAHLTKEEQESLGFIGQDLSSGVKYVCNNLKTFSPRSIIQSKNVTLKQAQENWLKLFQRQKMFALQRIEKGNCLQDTTSFTKRMGYKCEVWWRFQVMRKVIGRDTFYTTAEISKALNFFFPKPLFNIIRYLWRLAQKNKK